jgi:hypothetical protein
MSSQKTAADRFGVTDSDIRAARDEHRHIYRTGTHIPTRNDVATMPADQLLGIIDEWLWESPFQLIPTDKQIADVLVVLEARRDRTAVAPIIAACRRYLDA